MGVLAKPIPFGDYFLLEKLNTGGMAEVYKAKTFGVEGFERIVAVKKILPTIAEDKEFISMFIDEAKIAVQLQHANIVQIFDLGNISGDYYIAMEYVAGHDLRVIFDRCVRTNQKLDIGCVCYIISKICEGLDYAHNKKDASGEPMNIIHRDISPQNILISYDGDCKLIDFGIAKATNKSSATQVGILKGKFSYMSPEQVSGKANLDRRSDVFALGIVLYEMLTLKRLFLGASDFETLEKIRKVEVSPPTLYNSDIPEKLEDIVLKALEKDVDARYQTAAELQNALQRFMFSENIYYSAKELSDFCHKMFAQEIALEQKKVEFYKELTRDVLMQAKKPSTDAEDDTSFYDRHNVPKMSSVQYEVVKPARQSAPKQAIYAELDDFVPPSNNIVYSQKNGPAAPPETVEDIVSSHVNIEKAVPRKSITTDAVVVNKGRETTLTPIVPESNSNLRSIFIAIVVVLTIIIGIILVVGVVRNPKDAYDGQLQFTIYPKDVGHVWIEIGEQPRSSFGVDEPIKVNKLQTKKETHYRIGADGYQVAEGNVLADPDFQNIDVDLQPMSLTMLKMFVNSDGATVTVDDEPVSGVRHFEVSDILPGEHIVRVTKDGYKPEEKKITIKAGEQLNLTFDLKPAFAVLVLKTTYPSKYTIRNVRTGEIVKEGTTDSNGERISRLPIDDRFEIAVVDGDATFKKSWKPSSDVAIDEDQVLAITTQNDPKAAVAASDTSASANAVKPTPSSSRTGGSSGSSRKPHDNADSDSPKKPTQPAANNPPATTSSNIPGVLQVASKPPANIFVNGKSYGSTPKKIELPPGTYTIRFVNNEQGINSEQSVTVTAGQVQKVVRQ